MAEDDNIETIDIKSKLDILSRYIATDNSVNMRTVGFGLVAIAEAIVYAVSSQIKMAKVLENQQIKLNEVLNGLKDDFVENKKL